MNLSDQLITSLTTVAAAIVGVAIVAVLVSKQSQTGTVVGAAGNALATDIRAAVSPLSGSGLGLGGISLTTPTISFQ